MKKWKFNLIDILIVLCVVGAVFLGVTVLKGLQDTGTESAGSGDVSIRYSVEFTRKSQAVLDEFSKAKERGDVCYIGEKGRAAATLVDVVAKPAQRITTDMKTGNANISEIPEEYDITVVLESKASETEKEILADGTELLKVGKACAVKGKGYAGYGYVTSLEIID